MVAENDTKHAFPLLFPVLRDECELCGKRHKVDNCSLIGNLVEHIKDSETLSYARLTLPEHLKIKDLVDGRKTIVTNKVIPRGVQFGPFIAKTSSLMDMRIEFPIKIFLRDDENVYLESYEELFCNWMCLVLPASNRDEQNLYCYQMNTSIYFCTSKDIKSGEELRVWYSPFYAEKMGVERFSKPREIVHSSDEEFQEIYSSLQNDAELNLHNKNENAAPKKRKRAPKKSIPGANYHRIVLLSDLLPAEKLGAKERQKEWVCKSCGQVETNVAAYARHLMHHNFTAIMKQLSCPYCPKTFRKEGFHRDVHIQNCKNTKKPSEGKHGNKYEFVISKALSGGVADTSTNKIKEMEAKKSAECHGEMFLSFYNVNKIDIETNMWVDADTEKTENFSSTPNLIEDAKSKEAAGDPPLPIELPQEMSPEVEKNIETANFLKLDGKDNSTETSSNIEEKPNWDKDIGLESLAENLLPKTQLSTPILDLSDDIDFQLTKSLTDMINEDCNLEKSLSFSKNIRSLDIFGNVQGTTLLESDISVPQSTSIESSSFYSMTKTGFIQPHFTPCDDVTDEERNRIVENLLSETNEKFLNSDYEMTDGCVSEPLESDFNNQPNSNNDNCAKVKTKRANDFICDICKKGFAKQFYLYRHLRRHTGEFKCDQCLQVFARNENLQIHKSNCIKKLSSEHGPQFRTHCDLCKEQFFSLVELKDHMSKHYCQSESWKCSCGKISSDISLVTNHSCLFKAATITCVGCNRKFSTAEQFEKHKIEPLFKRFRKKAKKDKSLVCEICGMTFRSTNGVRIHRKTTHGNSKYECSICKKILMRNDTLVLHMKRCHTEPTVECPVCHKQLSDERHYKEHYKKSHSTTFKCEVCDKEFCQKGNLMKHYGTHNSDSIFSCDQCSATLKSQLSLKTHKLTHHPKNSQFKCEICDKCYPGNYQLKRHISNAHSKTFKCSYCQMIIKYRFKLKKHLGAKHGDKKTEWDSIHALEAMGQCMDSEKVRSLVTSKKTPQNTAKDILKTATDSALRDESLSNTDECVRVNYIENKGLTTTVVINENDNVENVERENNDKSSGLELVTLNLDSSSLANNVNVELMGEDMNETVVSLPLTVINGFSRENVSPMSLQQIPINLDIEADQGNPNVISVLSDNQIVNIPLSLPDGLQLALDNQDLTDKKMEEASEMPLISVNTVDNNGGSFVLAGDTFMQPTVPLENNVIFYIIETPESDSVT